MIEINQAKSVMARDHIASVSIVATRVSIVSKTIFSALERRLDFLESIANQLSAFVSYLPLDTDVKIVTRSLLISSKSFCASSSLKIVSSFFTSFLS